ncbi:MAG: DUF429 domain-containing protein [Actinomycetota bacterium]
MRCVGVDLAAKASATSLATLEWGDRPRVVDLLGTATDDEIVAACDGADAIGIDAPFGWPDAFVDFVAGHHRGADVVYDTDTTDLRLRVTDRVVWERTRKVPLSVSTDKIGIVAFRCAHLLGRLRGPGFARHGADGVFEVYPGGALAMWGLPSSGYKKRGADREAVRATIIDALEAVVEFGDFRGAALDSDDDLDAVMSALIAGLAQRGRTIRPDADQSAAAEREGWIHLPADALA